MTTRAQRAARDNLKKAQQVRQEMTPRERAIAQPQGRARAKPGTQGEGEYYRIVVRDKGEFTSFRTQDVGDKGHILRLAGKRSSGYWDTQTWLVSKDDAHMLGDQLIPDTRDARHLFETLGSQPMHQKGDVFTAKDRPNIPERAKPTEAQQRARAANIKKAQAARWKNHPKNG